MCCLNFTAKPSAPNGLQVIATTPDSISLAWRIPDTDGGSPITNYIIETRAPGVASRWMRANKKPVATTNYQILGLREGRFYDIRVCAENAAGAGPYTEMKGDGKSRSTPGLIILLHKEEGELICIENHYCLNNSLEVEFSSVCN